MHAFIINDLQRIVHQRNSSRATGGTMLIKVDERKATASNKPLLKRTTFRTSRLLDFASEKELQAQTGHSIDDWPLVVVKELFDNSLDACEEAGIAPARTVLLGTKRAATLSPAAQSLP